MMGIKADGHTEGTSPQRSTAIKNKSICATPAYACVFHLHPFCWVSQQYFNFVGDHCCTKQW
jgi:hypothetical protein